MANHRRRNESNDHVFVFDTQQAARIEGVCDTYVAHRDGLRLLRNQGTQLQFATMCNNMGKLLLQALHSYNTEEMVRELYRLAVQGHVELTTVARTQALRELLGVSIGLFEIARARK